MTSPSKLKQSFTASEEEDEDGPILGASTRSQNEPPSMDSSTHPFSIAAIARYTVLSSRTGGQNDNLSKLPPQLLHSMREAFTVLDTNGTGFVTPKDVTETLSTLGLTDPPSISQFSPMSFFPPGQPQQLALPQFLSQLANILMELSPPQELLNAFSAFDDDDSDQVDIDELREALLNTVPEKGERALTEKDVDRALEGFTGRRVFGRNATGISGVRGLQGGSTKKSGDVFRYQEFVGNLTGGPAGGQDVAQPVKA